MIPLLNAYDTITLEEMKKVQLMNRIDTKYLTTMPILIELLRQISGEYYVQTINGLKEMPYYTIYYDTSYYDMYLDHLHGHRTRQKIRIRTYEDSGISFLEIKNKNNKGRTDKKRIPYNSFDTKEDIDFINKNTHYSPDELHYQLENHFFRITLVNHSLTERLTIDSDLRFHSIDTDDACFMNDLVVIELKRDGRNTNSPILKILRNLRIHPTKFSKYCIGMALTNQSLKKNRFLPRLRMIGKICDIETGDKTLFNN